MKEKFLNTSYREMWEVATTPEEAVALLKSHFKK